MEQKRANNPRLTVEVLDKMMTDEFVDWFKKTVRTYYLSRISYIYSNRLIYFYSVERIPMQMKTCGI
jgi:tagatose-1,6-bisphosphate aldolase non-catalytic subunit AgaZ/GatZ